MSPIEVNIGVEAHLPFGGFENATSARWGLAIDYLKDRVEGLVFENSAVRLVISPEGFYYQFTASPTSFHGALRPVSGEFVSDHEARSHLWEAVSLYRAGEGRVLVIYGPGYRDDEGDLFMGTSINLEPLERGTVRLEAPLFFRADVDALEPSNLVGGRKGTAFLLRTFAGENILVRIPQDGRMSGVLRGLRE